MKFTRTVFGALAGLMLLGVASAASAETPWERHHPRRDEVIDRLQNQNHRITEERREGDLTAAQAHRLRAADYRIFHREQFDARHNDGHITRAEQYRLNRAENRVSRRIGR